MSNHPGGAPEVRIGVQAMRKPRSMESAGAPMTAWERCAAISARTSLPPANEGITTADRMPETVPMMYRHLQALQFFYLTS